MSERIFKSEAGRQKIEAGYQCFLKRIPVPVEERAIPTSIGPSHVLLAGDDSKPTLVALHGSLASSAHLLVEMSGLLAHYRVVALDLPGQSVRGPQTRLPLKDESLGRWVLEVLDGLGIDHFHLFGVSWGGFVARQVAQVAGERVQRLVLLVPAGIVNGSVWHGMTRMMWPLTMYRLFPSEKRFRNFFNNLFTTWDDDWANYMRAAFRYFCLDLRIPPVATDEQLRGLTMPTLVLGAGADISFPGQRLLTRVRSTMPQVEAELLEGSKHSPPTNVEFQQWLAQRLRRFLEVEKAVASNGA